MDKKKFLFIVFILFYSFVNCFSIMLNDNDNFFYYINKDNPLIKIEILLSAEPFTIKNATLISNGEVFESKSFEIDIPIGASDLAPLEFQVNSDLSQFSNDIFFKLNVDSLISGSNVNFIGSPSEFQIIVDKIAPVLDVGGDIRLTSNQNLNRIIQSNEKLSFYQVFLNGQSKSLWQSNSENLDDYVSKIVIDNISNFNEGNNNNLEIVARDLSGNEVVENINILYIGDDFNINLITKKEKPELKYFYDPLNPGLFEGKIFSSEQNFQLEIMTSKEAKCLFSNELISFIPYDRMINLSHQVMISTDNFTHTIDVNSGDNIWIGCFSSLYGEYSYLSTSLNLGETLIPIVLDTQNTFSINVNYPLAEVSQNNFDINIETSKKTVCKYNIDDGINNSLENQNYLTHFKNNVPITNGEHILNFECFDVLGNIIKKSHNFLVDPNIAFKILNFQPKFSVSPSVDITLTLNRNIEVCKYSKTNSVTAATFTSLNNSLSGSGSEKSFSINNLNEGENKFYIYCNQDGILVSDEFIISHSSRGPQISNFTFEKNGNKLIYLTSNLNKVKYDFEVESAIEVEKFIFEFKGGPQDYSKEVSSNRGNLDNFDINISEYSSLEVYGFNTLGIKGNSLTINLNFDNTKPIVSIIKSVGEKSFKISCSDSQSGCDDEKIFYSLSESIICNPLVKYRNNSLIDYGDSLYVCARALDKAENFGDAFLQLEENSNIEDIIDENNDNLDNETQTDNVDDSITDDNQDGDNTNDDIIDDTTDDGSNEPQEYPVVPIEPPTSSGSNLWIILSIVFLLLGISGGGYYAYKKGYLNNQLRKLGFKIPIQNENISEGQSFLNSNSKYYNNGVNREDFENRQNYNKTRVSKYEQRVKKLNDFITEKVNTKDEVLNKFKNNVKVRNSGDIGESDTETLIQKQEKVSDLSSDDFDEFYSKATGNKLIETEDNSTIEKQAEEFEEFYKNSKEAEEEEQDKDNLETDEDNDDDKKKSKK